VDRDIFFSVRKVNYIFNSFDRRQEKTNAARRNDLSVSQKFFTEEHASEKTDLF
jgi:hypothetical protein